MQKVYSVCAAAIMLIVLGAVLALLDKPIWLIAVLFMVFGALLGLMSDM